VLKEIQGYNGNMSSQMKKRGKLRRGVKPWLGGRDARREDRPFLTEAGLKRGVGVSVIKDTVFLSS